MERFLENLKDQAEANPVLAMGVAAGLLTAVSKLIDSSAGAMNAKSWRREVKRREKKIARSK